MQNVDGRGKMASRAAEDRVPVSASWEHAYRACEPAAAEVLRALSALNLESVSSPAVGVAVGLTPVETAAALADLERTGWAVAVASGERFVMVEQARNWLAKNAAELVQPARVVDIVGRFVEYHAAAVDLERHDSAEVGDWLARHHPEIMAVVRACDRDGLRGQGARLGYAVWPSAGLVPDPRWWEELTGAGETLAIGDRDPAMLADLLHHSAITFAEHGDRLRAEAQWVRALAVIRRDHREQGAIDQVEARDRDRGSAILTGLGALYRQWGRLSKALDADLGLVDLRRAAGDSVGTAQALTQVAVTMRAAGRLSSAADYFAKADDAISPIIQAGGSHEVVAVHAGILVGWGRTLWDQEHYGAARRRWSRALAILIDVDDNAADHVRALLATAPEHPLPAGPITAP